MESNKEPVDTTRPDEESLPEGPAESQQNFFHRAWNRLIALGMAEGAIRVASLVLTVSVFALVVWVMARFYTSTAGGSVSELAAISAPTPFPTPEVAVPAFKAAGSTTTQKGVSRLATLHTILPERARTNLVTYVVQPGDSLFSIAQKFNLKPESVLWGNRYTLGDDPHLIFPGQELIIMPVDGTLHRWSAGEGLNGVAEYYHVSPEDIINYPANGLNPATVGDYANPNIEPGKLLIVPGGYGEFSDYRTPTITREDPAVARNVGPGACVEAYDGVMGTLNFTWPTLGQTLSGYDYDPNSNHFGIDIGGEMGEDIFASDNGVVVYAGWNDWGYGNMVVIDHGSGWQTYYAHISTITVGCGQEVYRGDVIGTMGDTGTADGVHLHFEIRSDEVGRVNPWDVLR